MQAKRTGVVGGGAAGFFLAIQLKKLCPQMQVTILEAGNRVLRKVKVSGGGRCNVTNTFEDVSDLRQVYPRGYRVLKRLFKQFDHRDAWQWFERHGVRLVAQEDHCVFPQSQDAQTVIDLFLSEARRLGVIVRTGCRVGSLEELADYDYICITTGGQPRRDGLLWLGQEIVAPVPSLFTLSIADERLTALQGTVLPSASVMIPGTKWRAAGPLLITHWGMSGPAILRLSSLAARFLAEANYKAPFLVNWAGVAEGEADEALLSVIEQYPQKLITSVSPSFIPQRLWAYLCMKALEQRAHAPWSSLNAKERRRLVNVLTTDEYHTTGRAPHRDEFVTCGGVALTAVNPNTLESRTHPRLFFAGEVLDIDGVTGGFNFQAAWTTASVVAKAIAEQSNSL